MILTEGSIGEVDAIFNLDLYQVTEWEDDYLWIHKFFDNFADKVDSAVIVRRFNDETKLAVFRSMEGIPRHPDHKPYRERVIRKNTKKALEKRINEFNERNKK